MVEDINEVKHTADKNKLPLEVKEEQIQEGLVPRDLDIDPAAVAKLEEAVAAWEGGPDTVVATEMLQNLMDRVNGWVPGGEKKMQMRTDARERRDVLLSGSDVIAGIWGTTSQGRLETVRNELQGAPFLKRLIARVNGGASDIKRGEEITKGDPDGMKAHEWQNISADCVIAHLQAGNRPHVRSNVTKALTGIGPRLGQEERTSEVYAEALDKVDNAVSPIRASLLYHINGAIGPAKSL